MHEGAFTEEIVSSIVEQLKGYRGKTPRRIRVIVGETYHLIKESVLMHYHILTKGTPLEKIAIDLHEEPVAVFCTDCQSTGPVEDHHMLMCSACGSLNVKIKSGNEITTEIITE